jgi:NAD-dependent dihydropyrimidine dehydrogenase PreA subunit
VSTNSYFVPNISGPGKAIIINPDKCIRCKKCIEVCRSDVMVPDPEEDGMPIVLYPDECWFCGCCVEHCPVPEAIQMIHPMNQQMGWRRKDTGEYFRIGMQNPPPPNTKPPVSSWMKKTK